MLLAAYNSPQQHRYVLVGTLLRSRLVLGRSFELSVSRLGRRRSMTAAEHGCIGGGMGG
jgi:hypothetical protein